VDFLPGLVTPIVGVVVTELDQQTRFVIYFLVIHYSAFYLFICAMLEH